MKNSRGLYFSILLILVSALVAYIFLKKRTLSEEPAKASAELQRVQQADLQALKKGDQSQAEAIALALRRYTSQSPPEAEEFIKKYLLSENYKIQAAALEAAGAYSWADIELLAQALQSNKQEVRLAALRGLAKRSEKKRELLVENFLGQSNLNDEEWFAAKFAQLKLAREENMRIEIKKPLLSRAKLASSLVRETVYPELFTLLPDDDELKTVARDLLQNKRELESAVLNQRALQYLAAYDEQWLTQQLSDLNLEGDEALQIAVIDFLASHCPPYLDTLEKKLVAQVASKNVSEYLLRADLASRCP